MSDTRTDLPSISAPNFEQRVREVLMTYLGRQGNPLDRGLTLRDLLEGGVIKIKDGYAVRTGSTTIPVEPAQPPNEVDLTPPPTPTGFVVNSAISHVFIQHDDPVYLQGRGHLRTRVYGVIYTSGPLPVFNDAIEITQFAGTIHAHPSNPATTWRLWIKWESKDGVLSVSPAGGTNGLAVTTAQDVSSLLQALNGQLTESQLYSTLNERIDLIDDPSSGLVTRVDTLEVGFGSTLSAANSAAAAAQSASDAAAAEAAAIIAQTNAELASANAETAESSAQTSAMNAANSASAAATSASTATTKATEASQFATAAANSATTATTKASEASTSASQAATSATNAAGSASSASTSATTAANSATAAGTSATNAANSASAAATSATNAATFATNAGNSATAANSSAVAAQSSYGDSVRLNGNYSFSQGKTGWSQTATGGEEVLGTIETGGPTANAKLTLAGNAQGFWNRKIPIVRTRTYRVRFRVRAVGTTGSIVYAGVATYDANGNIETTSPGSHRYCAANAVSIPNDGTWKTYEGIITGEGNSTPNQFRTTSVFASPMFLVNYLQSSSFVCEVDECSIEDITESTAASNSASAAATSASSAATSASNAASSASAASTSATNASTSASNAQTFANQASTSATNASNSASSASTSAGAAATSATNASNSASAAATSASTATTRASEAALSATAASTSATNAATSASNASVSATNAATSATNASGSATAAASSATQVQSAIRAVSLALPLDQWTLNGQSIVTIADGKAGNQALRLVGIGGGYPNQGNFVPINPGKTYRVKFWARPSSNAAGLLYFSLRQFTTNSAGSPGPVNGGRSPYKPSGTSRAAHISTYGDTWGEYNFTWSDADWQAGATYFQPEFLDNYSGAAGHWDIQALTISDATDIQTVSASVQTLATTVAGPNGSTAQYTVKVDANGYVSGFGLSSTDNNATPFSEFTVVADKFSIAPVATNPASADGSPFFYLTAPTTIGGVQIPAGAYMKAAYIHDASITNAKIGSLQVDSTKVSDLSADKVIFGEMSGERIQSSSLDANRIRTSTLLASTSITANSGTGSIITISGEGYIDADGPLKRTRMDSGNVTTFLKVPSVGDIPYQSLTHVEVGTCQNNTQVVIPGYFAVQPKVIVSPAELGVYNKDFAAQSQTLICTPGAITQTGVDTYRWQFTPTATLSLLGTEQGQAINANSGTLSTNTYTTTSRQAPANTDRLTIEMQFLSVRGTGTSGSYRNRQVTWTIQYSSDNVNWTNGVSTTVAIGNNISTYVASTLIQTMPSAAAWYWRCACTAADTGATFSTGGPQYNFAQATVGGSVGSANVYVDAATATSLNADVNITMNAYSPPAGYSIYQVDYSYSISYSLWATSASSTATGTGTFRRFDNTNFDSISSTNQNDRSKTGTYTRSFSQTTYSTSFKGGNCLATRSSGAAARSQTTGGSVSATVYSRQLITNSTTPVNNFNLISRSARIVGAQVLATGTLNWMAVGE